MSEFIRSSWWQRWISPVHRFHVYGMAGGSVYLMLMLPVPGQEGTYASVTSAVDSLGPPERSWHDCGSGRCSG